MVISLNLPKKCRNWDAKALELELNTNIEHILHELEILRDLKECREAGPERFYNL